MAGKTLDEARTAQHNAQRIGHNGNTNLQQTTTATTNMATTSGTSQETTITINGQTFILMPTAATTTSPALVNMVIALSDTVFLGNLSDYDTDVPSFSPSVNIA